MAMTIGESISELYRSRTDADFDHMRQRVEAMNASLPPNREKKSRKVIARAT